MFNLIDELVPYKQIDLVRSHRKLVIEQDLSLSDKEIAVLNGVTFLVCGALTIFTAPIMLKFEARSVLIFCALCNSFGSFMFLLTSNYWLLVLGRSLNGLA